MTGDGALAGRGGAAGVRRALLGPLRGELVCALGPRLEPGWSVGRCRPRRAKLKPGRKLSAEYELELRGPGGRRERRMAALALVAEPEPLGELAPLQEELARRRLAAPFRELLAVSPDGRLVVRACPLDERFGQLARLSDGACAGALLGLAGGRLAVEHVRYRPAQRHVLRYRAAGEATNGRALYAKLYRDDRGRRAFRAAAAAGEEVEQPGGEVSVAQPLAYVEEEAALLVPEQPGAPLSRALSHGAPAALAQLRRAGALLRALHGLPAARVSFLPAHDLEGELAEIDRAAQHVDALLPALGARARAVTSHAWELCEGLGAEPPGFVHRDFKGDHLLAGGERLVLIDFDSCVLADPALDVGKLLADLAWWQIAAGAPARGGAEAFLAGYADGGMRERLARSRLYEALFLVKIAARRPKLFEARWEQEVAALVARAERVVEGYRSVA